MLVLQITHGLGVLPDKYSDLKFDKTIFLYSKDFESTAEVNQESTEGTEAMKERKKKFKETGILE